MALCRFVGDVNITAFVAVTWRIGDATARAVWGRMHRVQRVSVVGCSGSGKTTAARALAASLDVPLLELDSIFHLPGWRELRADDFRARTAQFVAADGWVVDGNYATVREPVVWPQADTVVWLDLPRRTVMRRLVWRSLRRVVTREALWNGNREGVRSLLARDPEQSIIVWAWTNHARYRAQYEAATTDPRWSHLTFVRITGGRDIERLLAAAGGR